MKRTEQAIREFIAEKEEVLKQRVVKIFIEEIATSVFCTEHGKIGLGQSIYLQWSQEILDDIEDIVKEVLDFDEDPTVSA